MKGKGPCSSRSARVGPSTSSMTRALVPPISSRPKIEAMFGWWSWARSCASRSNLARRSSSSVKAGGQDLDRDVALELGVGRAVDLPHAAFAELVGDLVGAEPSPDHGVPITGASLSGFSSAPVWSPAPLPVPLRTTLRSGRERLGAGAADHPSGRRGVELRPDRERQAVAKQVDRHHEPPLLGQRFLGQGLCRSCAALQQEASRNILRGQSAATRSAACIVGRSVTLTPVPDIQ